MTILELRKLPGNLRLPVGLCSFGALVTALGALRLLGPDQARTVGQLFLATGLLAYVGGAWTTAVPTFGGLFVALVGWLFDDTPGPERLIYLGYAVLPLLVRGSVWVWSKMVGASPAEQAETEAPGE